MNEIEIKTLAKRAINGEIYTSFQVPNIEDIKMSFVPLIFMKEKQGDVLQHCKIGLLYEEMSRASLFKVGDRPVFLTYQVLSCEEADIFIREFKILRGDKQENVIHPMNDLLVYKGSKQQHLC